MAILAFLGGCVQFIVYVCFFIWLSISWRKTKKQVEVELEEKRIKREEDAARKAEIEAEKERQSELLNQKRLEQIYSIFKSPPWDKWSSDVHSIPYQDNRIKRAYEETNLKLLSYCPSDQSAKIRGNSYRIYKVTPATCECPDFESRHYPCKHMYYLARKLFEGFDDDTFIGEQHNILSDREQEEIWKRHEIEQRIPHKNIIAFLRNGGVVMRKDIVNAFSVLDEKDVYRAITELYKIGSIKGEKRGGRYYHWIENDNE